MTAPALADDYVYDGIVTGLSIHLFIERPAVAVGETVYEATYCAKPDEFRCVDSQVFAFAAPKTGLTKGRTWNVRGKTYTLTVALQDRQVLGRKYEVCVIESSFKDRGESVFRKFLFSPKSGLLAVEERILANGRWSGDVYVSRSLSDATMGDRTDFGYGAQ